METISDILKITLPAIIVLLTAWALLSRLMKNEQEKRKQELILQNKRLVTPIILQAYERIVLFLERISLESLIVRISSANMNAAELQSALISSIRSEYEHNLSQQIYMSVQAWEVVKNARSNMIRIINTEAERMKEKSTAMDLSKALLEKIMEMEKEPTKAAIEFVKAEVGKYL
jgi:hypothetical protein